MCDKTYNVLKWMAQLLLPAMGTLYFALASIWRLPYGEQVVGTITAVDTFLGVILGITTAQYKQKQKTDSHHPAVPRLQSEKPVGRQIEKQGEIQGENAVAEESCALRR